MLRMVRSVTTWLLLLAFGCAAAAPAVCAADRLQVRADASGVSLAVDAPVTDVLERLRQETGVHLIVEGSPRARVELEADRLSPAEAVRRVAEAAGLDLEEIPGAAGGGSASLFVLRVRREGEPAIVGQAGLYRAPDAFDYPVEVLPDGPTAAGERERLGSLETTEGVSLMVTPKLRDALYQQYVRHRATYERVLLRGGVRMRLPGDLPVRNVRIYVDRSQDIYLAEALFADGPRHVGRLVWRVRPHDQRVLRLTAGRWAKIGAGAEAAEGPAAPTPPVDASPDGR
jgi:hypothetical protein